MEQVLVVISNALPEVVYQTEGVDVTIINMDERDLYTYKDSICMISQVNDDGTVNLTVVDTTVGAINNRHFRGIPVSEIEFYSNDFDSDLLEDYEDEEF
jgi:hypothetical protein